MDQKNKKISRNNKSKVKPAQSNNLSKDINANLSFSGTKNIMKYR